MRTTPALLATCIAATVSLTFPAIAQDGPASPPPAMQDQGEGGQTADPCAVDPGDATGEAPEDGANATADQSLTETLDECDGVLQPPAVGDPGLVEPAPDAGRTPVIPPSELPEDDAPATGD